MRVGQAFRDAGKDPGQDDAGISACTHEHAVRDLLRDIRQDILVLADSMVAAVDRQIHVVAGIAVRHRENIKVVDFFAVLVQIRGPVPDHFRVEFSVQH